MKIFFLSFLLLFSACTAPENPDTELDNFYEGIIPEMEIEDTSSSLNPSSMNTFSQTALPAEGEEILVMETNFGTMKFRLFKEQAPKTVENITTHAKNGYYNGLVFHRVIKDFMIQGGDPLGTGMGGESIWGEKFEDEFHADLKNIKGALSMANAGPNTNGSQFFIVSALSTPWLDNMHTVFGQLISGNEVLEQISQVQTGELDRPLEDVIIEQMLLENFAL